VAGDDVCRAKMIPVAGRSARSARPDNVLAREARHAMGATELATFGVFRMCA
jgi:hypothetical protein